MDARSKEFFDESQLDLFSDQVLEHVNIAYRFSILISGNEKVAFETIKNVCGKIKKDSSMLHLNQDGKLFVTKLCWESLNTQSFGGFDLDIGIPNWSSLDIKERAVLTTADYMDLIITDACELLGWSHDQYVKQLSNAREKVLK